MCHAYIHGKSFRLLIEIYGQCFFGMRSSTILDASFNLDARQSYWGRRITQDGVSVSLPAPEPRLHRLCKAPQTQDTAQRC